VEELIQADRRITMGGVATALGCSHGLAYSIMNDCDAIHRKHPGQLARVVLHHENARPHTTQAIQKRIQE
jgi:hypothetical protein